MVLYFTKVSFKPNFDENYEIRPTKKGTIQSFD